MVDPNTQVYVCQAVQTQYIPSVTHHSASIFIPAPKLPLPPVFSISMFGTTIQSVTQARNSRVVPNFTLLFQSVLEFCQFSFVLKYYGSPPTSLHSHCQQPIVVSLFSLVRTTETTSKLVSVSPFLFLSNLVFILQPEFLKNAP